MAEYLIQDKTLGAIADKVRGYLGGEGIPLQGSSGGAIAQGSVIVYYSEYIDYEDTSYDGTVQGDRGCDTFVEYGYLENDRGVVVPVLFKTDIASYGDETDYDDQFFYEGTAEIDGVVYDKWRKIEINVEFTWESAAKQFVYTNVIVGVGSEGINPIDFPSKVDDVYNIGYETGSKASYQEGYDEGYQAGHDAGVGITYDANARDIDMALGASAWVKGERVEGSVPAIAGVNHVSGAPHLNSSGKVELLKFFTDPMLFRRNSQINISAPLSDFGDATAEDVAEGKIFTSAAGLKAVGTAQSGGSEGAEFDYIAYWDEMLGDSYTEVGGGDVYNEEGETIASYAPTSVLARETYNNRCVIIPQGILTDYGVSNPYDLIVIPRSIENIIELAFENAPFCTVICLAPNPPTLGWQGYWSMDGGCSPPSAIYVPDASVDAYKADTTWAEYADAVRPLSHFNYSELSGGEE